MIQIAPTQVGECVTQESVCADVAAQVVLRVDVDVDVLSPGSRPHPQLASGSASATSASAATSLSNTSASATSSSTATGGGGACEVFSPSGSASSVVWAGTKCKSCGQPKRAHS
eukprot:g62131.t1